MGWQKYLIILFCFFIACENKPTIENGNKIPAALVQLNEKIKNDPNNAALFFQRGQWYKNNKLDSLAFGDLVRATELDSSKANYFSAVGDFLFDKKDVSASVVWFQKAIALNPEDETAHLKMAQMFLITKEYPKAFGEINTVLRQNVYNPRAYFFKGMVYKDMLDTAHAISSFQTSVQVDPKFYDGYMQLGLLFSAKKDMLALSYFENAYKLDTRNMEPLYAQAMFYQNQEKFPEAKKIFHRIIGLDPNYAIAHYNMGWMFLQEDSTQNAWNEFDRAILLEPDYADAYYNRGLCSEILGKFPEAKADYEQCLVFQSNHNLAQSALKRLKEKM